MMYILQSLQDPSIISIYCDQRKCRSWLTVQSVPNAIGDINLGNVRSCSTLAIAVKDVALTSKKAPFKVYSQDDYPELFI